MSFCGVAHVATPFDLNEETKMIDIHFEIGGRRVNPGNTRDALEAAMFGAVEDGIRKKLGACRCPEHGKTPKLTAKGRSLETIKFEISGCCEGIIGEVKRKLGAS